MIRVKPPTLQSPADGEIPRLHHSTIRQSGPREPAADDFMLLETTQVDMNILRTYSLPLESAASSISEPSPATAFSRATFPFKPASKLLILQKSQTTDMSKIPTAHRHREYDVEKSSSYDYSCYLPITNFRFRPVVPAFAMHPPRPRSASYPDDSHSVHNNQPSSSPPEPPDWLVYDVTEKSSPLFPIPVDSPTTESSSWWWLGEMDKIVKKKLSTVVQVEVGEDEIECVESEEDEVEILEEFLVQESRQTQCQVTKESIAPIDISSAAPSSPMSLKILNDISQRQYSSDDLEIVQGEVKDLRMVELDPGKRMQVKRLLCQGVGTNADNAIPPKQYSSDDSEILQGEMKDLRIEEIDPEKRLQVESLLRQVEGDIATDGQNFETTTAKESCSVEDDDKEKTQQSTLDHIRRTTVAITGGTLTVAGVVLIPCPIIPGALVVYGGLLVLVTEFESAKRAVNTVKEPIEKWLSDDDNDNDENKEGADEFAKEECSNSIMWEEMIGYNSLFDGQKRIHDIDEDFMTLVDMKRSDFVANGSKEDTDSQKSKPAKNNAVKQFFRKILIGDPNKQSEELTEEKHNWKTTAPPESNSDDKHSKNNHPPLRPVTPLSPSCDSIQSGCRFMPFDFGDDEDVGEDHAKNIDEPHRRQQRNNRSLSRIYSDESITLNAVTNDCEEMKSFHGVFSRQNSIEGSAHGNNADCDWFRLEDCDALSEEGCPRSEGRAIEVCNPGDLAIEQR